MSRRQVLSELGVARSIYYRWCRGQPDSRNLKRPWNRIIPEEEDKILAVARESPELKQPATGNLDHRQRGLFGIRVNGVPHSKKGRASETSGDATLGR